MANREKVKEQYRDDKHIHYHESQFGEAKRSTLSLMEFVKKTLIPDLPYSAIDVGCGAGANIYHLSNVLGRTKWIGLDYADNFFPIGKIFLNDSDKVKFVKGDFYKLGRLFPQKSFDISFSIQTLSWLPNYVEAMKEIFFITKRIIFVTSLFSDFNVDAFIDIYEYEEDLSQTEDSPYNYNVYSLEKFKEFCIENGAADVIAEDFIMDVDLVKPDSNTMGTYTIKKNDGQNMQFSGPLFLPWKMIAIRLE